MQGYRDDGVVLRTQKLGEADRIITVLTRQNGRVRAVAKGVRRTKSRFGGRLEPFTHVDVLIHPGRSLDIIMQAEVIRAYGKPLATDYPRYTAGTAMLETAERLTPVEKEPAIRQFLLLIGGLRALGEALEPDRTDDLDDTPGNPNEDGEPGEAGNHDNPGEDGEALEPDRTDDLDDTAENPGKGGAGRGAAEGGATEGGAGRGAAEGGAGGGAAEDGRAEPAAGASTGTSLSEPREPRLVLDSYLLRSLALEGYAPALQECARCGTADTPLVAFAIAAGGMVCANCRPPGAASPAPQTVALLRALVRGDWELAMRSERRHRVECSGLVAAYLQWHLEHSIRSLRHVERA